MIIRLIPYWKFKRDINITLELMSDEIFREMELVSDFKKKTTSYKLFQIMRLSNNEFKVKRMVLIGYNKFIPEIHLKIDGIGSKCKVEFEIKYELFVYALLFLIGFMFLSKSFVVFILFYLAVVGYFNYESQLFIKAISSVLNKQ